MSKPRLPLTLYKVRHLSGLIRVLATLLLLATTTSCMNTPANAPHNITYTPTIQPTLRALAQARGIAIGAAVDAEALQSDSQYRDILGQQFNILTPENAMKIVTIQPERNVYNFKDADAVVAFAMAHNMQVRGHVLVWGLNYVLPSWLTGGNFSRNTLIAILRDYIYTVVSRYRGRVSIWDVVNEAVDPNGSLGSSFWLQKIGPDYIDMAFRWAHEADPQALLFYNDYGEGLSRKSDAIYALVKGLLHRGVPLNGVGLQMHVSVGASPMPQDVLANMQRLAALGLQVQITEMDVQIQRAGGTLPEKLAEQANIYRDMLAVCLEVTKCTAFEMWGFTDRYSWIYASTGHADAPLIFDSLYHPKPAYFALLAELANN